MKRVPRRRGTSQTAPVRPAPAAARPKTGPGAKSKERLDVALVTRGLALTREKAARLIMAGHVEVNGRRADKAGVLIDERGVRWTFGAGAAVAFGAAMVGWARRGTLASNDRESIGQRSRLAPSTPPP